MENSIYVQLRHNATSLSYLNCLCIWESGGKLVGGVDGWMALVVCDDI